MDCSGSSSSSSSSSSCCGSPYRYVNVCPHPRNWLTTLLERHEKAKDDVAGGGIGTDGGIGIGIGGAPADLIRSRKALVVAPMVDQSDLPFRLLCRRYGANLCYTPMIHARLLVENPLYRRKFLPRRADSSSSSSIPSSSSSSISSSSSSLETFDRPLVAQLCGHDADTCVKAARLLAPHVDAIDLNCGCPQNIAKRGRYGAFLLEDEPETVLNVLSRLVRELPHTPIAVKVRLLSSSSTASKSDEKVDTNGNRNGNVDHSDHHHHHHHGDDDDSDDDDDGDDDDDDDGDDMTTSYSIPSSDVEASMDLYGRLIDTGIALLCIHGRNRRQKGTLVGDADWDAIRLAVQRYGRRIPILANGGVSDLSCDVRRCLSHTNADGVMSSESILEYPALFDHRNEPPPPPHEEEGKEQTGMPSSLAAPPSYTSSSSSASSSSSSSSSSRSRSFVGRIELAREYMELARCHPPQHGGQGSGLKCLRVHCHRMLHPYLQRWTDLRKEMASARSVKDLHDVINAIETRRQNNTPPWTKDQRRRPEQGPKHPQPQGTDAIAAASTTTTTSTQTMTTSTSPPTTSSSATPKEMTSKKLEGEEEEEEKKETHVVEEEEEEEGDHNPTRETPQMSSSSSCLYSYSWERYHGWYFRHRHRCIVDDKEDDDDDDDDGKANKGMSPGTARRRRESTVKESTRIHAEAVMDDAADCFVGLFGDDDIDDDG